MMFVAGFLLLVLASFSNAKSIGYLPRPKPYPICSQCVPREDILAPGIGFDLTFSYATAAIRYYNGSVRDLGRVNGYDEYRALMIRLADPASRPACDRDDLNFWEKVRCAPGHAGRRINKLRGFPATPEVGIIAQILEQLRVLVDSKLGKGTMKKVLPAIPQLPGLWRIAEHDLTDALEYAGLGRLSTHKHIPKDVSETSATLAGLNYGLCMDYNHVDKCEDEENHDARFHVLTLSLSQTAFTATCSLMRSAYIDGPLRDITSFDLGLRNVPKDEIGKERYWKDIRNAIVDVGRKPVGPLRYILLVGEDADNPIFGRVVKDALRSLIPAAEIEKSEVVFSGLNARSSSLNAYSPLYVAARGAAEFAKRAQEAPVGCIEPAHCAGNRWPPRESGNTQIPFAEEL